MVLGHNISLSDVVTFGDLTISDRIIGNHWNRIVCMVSFAYVLSGSRPFSSVGQSVRLIIARSLVQVQQGPPNHYLRIRKS